MTLKRFKHLLDAYGADLARWPAAERRAARALIAADAQARQARDETAELDAMLDRYAPEPVSPARVAARLRSLPPPATDWRAALAELWWELRALPRVLAMVAVVLAGFLVGFISLDLARSPHGGTDVSALVFEPGPSDWLQL
ncbi:MAG TPA: hypothetical protein VMB81_07970 [Candidatus Sulfotelmatobacter sp.]|nr:hypothetical protein [Candidatus Sulfotelmatobacter sp.]